MPGRWFATAIEYRLECLNWRIVLTTDAPCHLWLRWSRNKPQRHPREKVVRGLRVMGDVYYCFTAYNDIEQDEAGDTTEHTFTINDWPFSEMRYFYFFGQIGGIDSPSESCIFEHRMPITSPLVNGSFETWADPAGDPTGWTREETGVGERLWEREEVNVKEGIYCPKLSAFGLGCTTQYRQFIGAQYYWGYTCRFTFWERGAQGSAKLRGVGAFKSWNIGAHGDWRKRTHTGFVNPASKNICFWFYARGRAGGWNTHWFDLVEIERL